MDESHRLKPMIEGYDRTLFESLYQDTKNLRKKLAFEIDHRKFGVDHDEIISWFDVKFIHAFNKYYGDDKLKGFIINSLRTYKLHIVKKSYLPKNTLHNTTDISELYDLADEGGDSKELDKLLVTVKNYIKARVSDDAYFLFEIELNPPPYVLVRVTNPEQKKIPKIPAELLAEYMGIDDNLDYAIEYINRLRGELKSMIKQAREYFLMQPLSTSTLK